MSDLIERSAAIDALEKSRFLGAPYVDTGIQIALREIKALPSAQPEKRTEERAETHACDLIERQAARLAKCPFDGLNDYERGWNDACDAIADNAPPALANNSPKVDKENGDLIQRQAAIDALDCINGTEEVLRSLPSAQPEDWMERNKERILQAGMEGREIEFRIGGRLFAIREKAQ